MDTLQIIGRSKPLFLQDLSANASRIDHCIRDARVLVVGGAGTIGQAVTKELFHRAPKSLHVVDLSENNLVELVRSIRSSQGYTVEDFQTFAIDCNSVEFDSLIESQANYDYVFNLSAMKHVRSESDAFSLMRMQTVNILGAQKIALLAERMQAKSHFCVSTDKSVNSVNLMGASKRLMEAFVFDSTERTPSITARFANVAFSDGSLLNGFQQRFLRRQPIAVPKDVKRYFFTDIESGRLCLLAAVLGGHAEIFVPKESNELKLTSFVDVLERFLHEQGYEMFLCSNENEARDRGPELIKGGKWPCLVSISDTTGEKKYEEFKGNERVVIPDRFETVQVLKHPGDITTQMLGEFKRKILALRASGVWSKADILDCYRCVLNDFMHEELDKFLDEKM